MAVFELNVTWSMSGKIAVVASSLEEAEKTAMDMYVIPSDGEYIDGTYELDKEALGYGTQLK